MSQPITNSNGLTLYTTNDVVLLRCMITSYVGQTLTLAVDTPSVNDTPQTLTITVPVNLTYDPLNHVPLVAGNEILVQCLVNSIAGSGGLAVINVTVQENSFSCSPASINITGRQIKNSSKIFSRLSS